MADVGGGDGVRANDDGGPVDSEGTPTEDPSKYVKAVDVRGKDGEQADMYDGTPKTPEVFDEQAKDESGNPKKLIEGTDYDVAYYEAKEDGTADASKPANAIDAGDKVAVVTLKGDYEGTVSVAMDVRARPITFKGDAKNFSYDGKSHVVDTLTVAGQGLVEGHAYGIRYRVEGTDKGVYAGAFVWPSRDGDPTVVYDETHTSPDTSSGFVFDGMGTDVTKNYQISFELGELSIGATKVKDNGNGEAIEVDENDQPAVGPDGKDVVRVTVAVDYNNDDAPIYDGEDHAPVVRDVQASKDLTEGTDYTIKYYEPKRDEAGNVALDDNGSPVPDRDKEISASDAGTSASGEKVAVVTLILDYNGEVVARANVRPRPVSFTGRSGEFGYTGRKQTVEGYDVSTGEREGLLTDEKFAHTTVVDGRDSVVAIAEATGVGTHAGTISAPGFVKIVDKDGVERTRNYSISTTPGEITITSVKVVDGGDGKGYPSDEGGWPIDDEGKPAKTGEDGKPQRGDDGNPVSEDGTPITPAVRVVGSQDGDKPTYDGTPKEPVVWDNRAADESGTPTPRKLEKGTDYDVEFFEPKRDEAGNVVLDDHGSPVPDRDRPTNATDAGEKVAEVTLKGDYLGTIVVPMEIVARELHIRTGSASKPYDGEPLTSDVVEIEGIVEGETVEVILTGSQTEIGESFNTYKVRFADQEEATTQSGTVATRTRDLSDQGDQDEADGVAGVLAAVAQLFSPTVAYADGTAGLALDGKPTAKSGNYTVNTAEGAGTLRVTAPLPESDQESAGGTTGNQGDQGNRGDQGGIDWGRPGGVQSRKRGPLTKTGDETLPAAALAVVAAVGAVLLAVGRSRRREGSSGEGRKK